MPAGTFSNQSRIPRLPVPPLKDSLQRYLRSLLPLTTPEEHARNVEFARDFSKPGGLGCTLQQRLIDIDHIAPYNWLDDTWWTRKAYHEWREPVIVNSNWYILFTDDPNTPRELFSENAGVRAKGEFTDWQLKRAAHLISKFTEFKDLIDSESLPPDSSRSYPFCMYQYTRCFGLTRIPQHGCDAFAHAPHPHPAKHVLIIAKDQFYAIDVYDKDGNRLCDGDVERQLQEIITDVQKAELDPPVGVLSADQRDHWAVNRENLLRHSQNRETLNVIETALFTIALDDYSTGVDNDAFLRNMFHALDGRNRWWDKAMTICIESNGRAAMNGEHSPADALIPAYIIDFAVRVPTELNARPSGRPFPTPKRLRFVTDEVDIAGIAAAQVRVNAVIADSDAVLLHFHEYGTDFIKQKAQVSPDGYMQMVLQLAYYRLYGRACATYETGSTRKFLHGRTETVRTLSVDSKAFVEGMLDPSLTPQHKYDLLKAAVTAHIAYVRDASEGKGCDRHLLGLRCCLREGESHALFEDPAFARSQRWLLSTSLLNALDSLNGTGFGCVYPEGYGINYMPFAHVIKAGIESKYSCKETSSGRFRESMVEALRDMRAVCEAVNGQYEQSGKGKL